MDKDKIPAPNPGTDGTHDEAFRDENEKEGQELAGGNKNIKDDKSVGEHADHGQRGSQTGQRRTGRKG